MHLSFRYWSATKNGKKAMTSAARVVVTDHDLVAVSWLLRFVLQTQARPRVKRSLSITAHYANNLGFAFYDDALCSVLVAASPYLNHGDMERKAHLARSMPRANTVPANESQRAGVLCGGRR